MISYATNCTITVTRKSSSTKNAIGEPVYTTSTPYSSIPARLDITHTRTAFNAQGERVTTSDLLMVDGQYTLQTNDTFINTLDGLVRKVVGEPMPITGQMDVLDHYEIETIIVP